jgi:hypothetical protein
VAERLAAVLRWQSGGAGGGGGGAGLLVGQLAQDASLQASYDPQPVSLTMRPEYGRYGL